MDCGVNGLWCVSGGWVGRMRQQVGALQPAGSSRRKMQHVKGCDGQCAARTCGSSRSPPFSRASAFSQNTWISLFSAAVVRSSDCRGGWGWGCKVWAGRCGQGFSCGPGWGGSRGGRRKAHGSKELRCVSPQIWRWSVGVRSRNENDGWQGPTEQLIALLAGHKPRVWGACLQIVRQCVDALLAEHKHHTGQQIPATGWPGGQDDEHGRGRVQPPDTARLRGCSSWQQAG